ncbi:MAG: hypothetical protein FJY91_00725 [Candidatus Harrisonbacteria bacterium]|nr:hypothetical protein [Candidatus Harrisonbacteria bacterium]
MKKQQKIFYKDLLFLTVSILFAFFFSVTGLATQLVASLNTLEWLGIFLAGLFFTSVFTTAPSIVLLGELAQVTPLPLLVLLGGLGAAVGDYIIFRFVKDKISSDFTYLFSSKRKKGWISFFRTRFFRFFIPILGALIIASPFPDEIGVAMLGLSKVKSRVFFTIAFIFNSMGIFTIGLIAKTLTEG